MSGFFFSDALLYVLLGRAIAHGDSEIAFWALVVVCLPGVWGVSVFLGWAMEGMGDA